MADGRSAVYSELYPSSQYGSSFQPGSFQPVESGGQAQERIHVDPFFTSGECNPCFWASVGTVRLSRRLISALVDRARCAFVGRRPSKASAPHFMREFPFHEQNLETGIDKYTVNFKDPATKMVMPVQSMGVFSNEMHLLTKVLN